MNISLESVRGGGHEKIDLPARKSTKPIHRRHADSFVAVVATEGSRRNSLANVDLEPLPDFGIVVDGAKPERIGHNAASKNSSFLQSLQNGWHLNLGDGLGLGGIGIVVDGTTIVFATLGKVNRYANHNSYSGEKQEGTNYRHSPFLALFFSVIVIRRQWLARNDWCRQLRQRHVELLPRRTQLHLQIIDYRMIVRDPRLDQIFGGSLWIIRTTVCGHSRGSSNIFRPPLPLARTPEGDYGNGARGREGHCGRGIEQVRRGVDGRWDGNVVIVTAHAGIIETGGIDYFRSVDGRGVDGCCHWVGVATAHFKIGGLAVLRFVCGVHCSGRY
mmetsp:Transcript_2882/g.6202  ORF Transcript_2882/g.6202 Transcript_2882/m.6202 type:complete len:330 (-) Transcript_2882:3-992(-)